MSKIEIAGQVISIIAMTCNIFSYQQKKQSRLIAMQLFGGSLFAISYFLLGAVVGGLLNVVAAIRAVIYLFSDKLHASHPAWFWSFTCVYASFYVLSFTVFGVKPTPVALIMEILPVIGMTASHIGFRLANSKSVRRLGLISSPAWLTYNIYYKSSGAIICEVISLVSIFVGMYRHDFKHKNTDSKDA